MWQRIFLKRKSKKYKLHLKLWKSWPKMKEFKTIVEAHDREDAQLFQSTLQRLGLIDHCHRICHWICYKVCLHKCDLVCPESKQMEVDWKEMREFAQSVSALTKDVNLIAKLIDALDNNDAKTFMTILRELRLVPYCRQICSWLCHFRCERRCHRLCPLPPMITHVGTIPTVQFTALNFANGPSVPLGPVPSPAPASGVGDHPFGGTTNIRGLFNIAGATRYKVEYSLNVVGPWNPIAATLQDFYVDGIPPFIHQYNRSPDMAGWYLISNMGLGSMGQTYLTDLATPAGTDVYYLRLTVENGMAVQFTSSVVTVHVDNEAPVVDTFELWLRKPDGQEVELGCCNGVKKGDGLILIKFRAWDKNFSSLALVAEGGCSVSVPIVDQVTGTFVSKTYNGNIAEQGEPVSRTVVWDPWADPKIESCCYLIHLYINDRTVINNYWAGGHSNNGHWVSLQISV